MVKSWCDESEKATIEALEKETIGYQVIKTFRKNGQGSMHNSRPCIKWSRVEH